MLKVCWRCKLPKDPEKDFGKNKREKDGLAGFCRPCSREYSRESRHKHDSPERRKQLAKKQEFRRASDPVGTSNYQWQYVLHRMYGITPDQYYELLAVQGGGCAVCHGKDPNRGSGRRNYNRFCVDHDHHTNEIRGLLCIPCNRALGLIVDDATALERGAAYLRNPPAREVLSAHLVPQHPLPDSQDRGGPSEGVLHPSEREAVLG